MSSTNTSISPSPIVAFCALVAAITMTASPVSAQPEFVNFESGHVRPLAISPDGSRLFAVNTPGNQVEIFDVSAGTLTPSETVAVGLEPVAVAARSNDEIWVVNHLSDSISILDVSTTPARVVRTLITGDEPRDIVFAGAGGNRAFITTARRGQHRSHGSIAAVTGAGDPDFLTPGIGRADVWVYDATSLGATVGGTPLEILSVFTDTPRALAVSNDGNTVYVAGFHTGNQTTSISEGLVCDGFGAAASCAGDGITSPGGLPGGVMPGGNPGPADNVEGIEAPETALIVRYNPATSTWEDELGRNWNNAVRFDLPDEDVFAINANTLAQIALHATVGTTLFNMAVNPVSGDLYVTNTESINDTRFEGPGVVGGSTVQGRLAESRITVIDNPNSTDITGTSIKPRHLNKHIDYNTLAHDVGFDATAKNHTLAQPTDVVVNSTGTTLYTAAFGSSKIGIFNVATLEADTFDPAVESTNYLTVGGGGPSGLVLDEANDRLYVMTRFDNAVAVIDLTAETEVDRFPLLNPEPVEVKAGRPFLYDAFFSSANGEASCASCHTFGDLDQIAWDLGNPDDVVTSNPVLIRLAIGAGPDVNGEAAVNQFHPMKGPMTTQTLRGMSNHGPMHWRGDRADGFFGQGSDEALSFNNFIVAFEGLLGRDQLLSTEQMQAFTDFALSLTLPPNPVRAIDNTLTPDEQAGRDFYLGSRKSDGIDAPNLGFTCNGCHTLAPGQGFFGADGNASFEFETQIIKIAHLRNAYTKVGMFGMPDIDFINAGNNAHQGDQVRGYGYLHDGSIDTIFRFFSANVFNNTGSVGFDGPASGDVKRLQMERYMLAFDNDVAPVVGQQVTLDSTNSVTVGPRIDLLIARASAPFLSKLMGGNVVECDLVVKGVIGGQSQGWVMNGAGDFVPDAAADPIVSDVALRALASTPGQELTYTCVPPGSGQRIGIDRDGDATLDRDDNCPGVNNPSQLDQDTDTIGDACDPDSAPTLCDVTPEPDFLCNLADPAGAGKSQVQFKNKAPDSKDKMKWKWNKGAALNLAQFGDPVAGTDTMSVCVYDTLGLHRAMDLPAGGVVPTCNGKPCWKTAGSTGFKYKNKLGDSDGITGVKLKANTAGKSIVQVKGKGADLLPPATAALSDVVVQLLISDGGSVECFKTGFADTGVKKQDAENFKAKGP